MAGNGEWAVGLSNLEPVNEKLDLGSGAVGCFWLEFSWFAVGNCGVRGWLEGAGEGAEVE